MGNPPASINSYRNIKNGANKAFETLSHISKLEISLTKSASLVIFMAYVWILLKNNAWGVNYNILRVLASVPHITYIETPLRNLLEYYF